MRTLTLIILGLLCVLPASIIALGGTSQKGGDPPMGADVQVTIEVKDTPTSTLITKLFTDYGFRDFLNIDSVKGFDRRLTVSVKEVPWNRALLLVSNAAGLSFALEEGKYTFSRAPANSVQQVLPAPVGLAPVQNQSSRNQAANAMLNQRNRGVIGVVPRLRGGTRVFDLNLDQANAFDVIRQLMDLSKRDYVLDVGPAADYNIPPPRVTARLSNVTVDEVLSMLRSNSDMETQRQGQRTIVRWRPKWTRSQAPTPYYVLTYAVLFTPNAPTPADLSQALSQSSTTNVRLAGVRGTVGCIPNQRWMVETSPGYSLPQQSPGSQAAPNPEDQLGKVTGIITPLSPPEIGVDVDCRMPHPTNGLIYVGNLHQRVRYGDVASVMLRPEKPNASSEKEPVLVLTLSVKPGGQASPQQHR